MAARLRAWSFVSYVKHATICERTLCRVYTPTRGCSTLSTSHGPLSSIPDCTLHTGPIAHYEELVHFGSLQEDIQQKAALWQLEQLQGRMTGYSNLPLSFPELKMRKDCSFSDEVPKISNLTEEMVLDRHSEEADSKKEKDEEERTKHNLNISSIVSDWARLPPPHGCYIHGSVGTGKTMLMDLFYSHVKNNRKKRVHFNSFMLDVHERIHRLKQSLPKRRLGETQTYDPIYPVAMEIGAETCLLCLDEFQVMRVAS